MALGTLVLFSGNTFLYGQTKTIPEHLQGYEGTEITVFGWSCEATAVQFYELIPEFERLTGMKVNIGMRIPVGRYIEKVTLETAAHTGSFDVCMIGDGILAKFVKNDWIVRLDPYLNNPRIADPNYNVKDFVKSHSPFMYFYGDDRVYWLPWRAIARGLFYRTDLFTEAGIAPPTTWQEELNAAQKFTKPPLYGIALHGKQAVGTSCVFDEQLWSNGGDFFDKDMKPIFNSKEGIEGLTHYCELMKYAPPGKFSFDMNEVITAFAQGTVAMMRNWIGSATTLMNPEASKVVGKWNVALLPAPRSGLVSHGRGGGWGWIINADSKHPQAAYKLIEWLSSSENEKRAIMLGGEAVPTRLSVFEDPEILEKNFYLSVYGQAADLAKAVPKIPEYSPEILTVIVVAITEASTGKKSPKEALDDAAVKVEKILREAGYYK